MRNCRFLFNFMSSFSRKNVYGGEVYEYMRDNSGLVRIQSPEAIDIETAIERALRPHFRKSPPKSETAVQDSIETILNALGIDFRREKDTAPIGRRAFRPDFTVDNLSLAILKGCTKTAFDLL